MPPGYILPLDEKVISAQVVCRAGRSIRANDEGFAYRAWKSVLAGNSEQPTAQSFIGARDRHERFHGLLAEVKIPGLARLQISWNFASSV